MRCVVSYLIVALGLACSCSESTRTTISVVLVDGSCSRSHAEHYQQAWQTVVMNVTEGDRIVVGRVRGDLVAFAPDLDATLPRRNILFDNAIDRERRRARFQTGVSGVVDRALAETCSDRTPLLDTIIGVAPLIESASQPIKRVLFLSDMIEDSSVARFGAAPITPELMRDLRSRHALPDFKGVDVFVAGADAPTSEIWRDIRSFWIEYFQVAGGRLLPEHYGVSLTGWAKE